MYLKTYEAAVQFLDSVRVSAWPGNVARHAAIPSCFQGSRSDSVYHTALSDCDKTVTASGCQREASVLEADVRAATGVYESPRHLLSGHCARQETPRPELS